MKKIIVLFLIIWGINTQAQTILKADKIKAIAFNEYGAISFYAQKKGGKFSEIYLDYKDEDSFEYKEIEPIIPYLEEEDDEVSLSEILEENEKIFYTKDIRPTSIKDFLGKNFITEKTFYEENTKTIVKIINNNIASLQKIEFKTREPYGGFGSYVNLPDDKEEKWRCVGASYYSLLILDVGEGKKIYLFNDESSVDNVIIPLKNDTLFFSDEENANSNIKEEKNIEIFYDAYDTEDFFGSRPNGKKYDLINIFNEKVLPKSYDTIFYNSNGIITRNDKNVEIYNNYFNKLKFSDLKSAYFYRTGVEVLDKNGAGYYQMTGKPIEKFPKISYALCGTVGYYRYKIEKEGDDYVLKYRASGATRPFSKDYYLIESPEYKEVTFIDGNTIFNWDGNSSFVGEKYGYPELLRIRKRKKYGLVEYKLDYEENNIKVIKGKIKLPFEYDDIKQQSDGLIYIYQGKKVGIYPQQTIPPYDYIERKTNSFYEIKKDGKRGYLDIQTFKEYF
ncbi:MAG: hypothetical protein Q3983_05290 [Capnocytophaga sp.]|nr:hypothetical protein [Capnocytophaga sp.]